MIPSTIITVVALVTPALSCSEEDAATAASVVTIAGTVVGTIAAVAAAAGRRRVSDRRRLDGRNYTLSFDDVEIHDPLCEWILNDGLDSEWTMIFDENREKEIDMLLKECENGFYTEESIAQCKFYVHAVNYYYTSTELLEDLKFDSNTEDSMTQYQKCGKVTVGLNDAISNGEISGIEIVPSHVEDGTVVDVFVLDEPPSSEQALQTSATITIGSMISSFIGFTLVKVCRDFDDNAFRWLL